MLNNLVYQKGGWVLHMLRQEVGTEHFWTAIREYYRRYRNGNASTADLRAVFEQVSGKPLDWFFTQWLNRPGVPKIDGSWRYDAVKKQVEVTLSQAQAAEPYRVNVDVGIVAKAGELPTVDDDRARGQAGHLHVSARRCTRIGRARPEYHPADGRRAVPQALAVVT